MLDGHQGAITPRPQVVLAGQLDTELSFVPDHLAFMLQASAGLALLVLG